MRKTVQIITWCLFLMFFFSQEKNIETKVYTPHIQKEYAFESNIDNPAHELDSDPTTSLFSFSTSYRTLDFLHIGFCSFIDKKQNQKSINTCNTNELLYSNHPNQTTQLRC